MRDDEAWNLAVDYVRANPFWPFNRWPFTVIGAWIILRGVPKTGTN